MTSVEVYATVHNTPMPYIVLYNIWVCPFMNHEYFTTLRIGTFVTVKIYETGISFADLSILCTAIRDYKYIRPPKDDIYLVYLKSRMGCCVRVLYTVYVQCCQAMNRLS